MIRVVKHKSGYTDRPPTSLLEIWTPVDESFYKMPRMLRKRLGTMGNTIYSPARILLMVDTEIVEQYTNETYQQT